MGHSDLSEISRIKRIKSDEYLVTNFNPDSYREDFIHTSMNDKDIDLIIIPMYRNINPYFIRFICVYSVKPEFAISVLFF
jgi:hypothetical protein